MVGKLILTYFNKKNIKGIQAAGKKSLISGIPKCIDKSCLYMGDNSHILGGARIQNVSGDPNVRVRIGSHTGIGYNFTVLAGANVTVGSHVAIASDVFLSSGSHGTNVENRLAYGEQPCQGQAIVIKDGAWIGEKVCIISGEGGRVSIGKKAVIGAGSVVTKSVPDYCIAVGNPAKVIKKYNFTTHAWEKVTGMALQK